MIDYFGLLAQYNRRANEAMYALLASLPQESWHREVGSFYRSISGVAHHIYQADLLWLKRIGAGFPGLKAPASVHGEEKPRADEGAPELAPLRDRRVRLDSVFQKLAGELTEEVLQRELSYTDTRGRKRRYILWQALVHIFNHQTHHRGQIAEILDQMKVANDYSNIVWYIAPPE